jgi:hypothetical protein
MRGASVFSLAPMWLLSLMRAGSSQSQSTCVPGQTPRGTTCVLNTALWEYNCKQEDMWLPGDELVMRKYNASTASDCAQLCENWNSATIGGPSGTGITALDSRCESFNYLTRDSTELPCQILSATVSSASQSTGVAIAPMNGVDYYERRDSTHPDQQTCGCAQRQCVSDAYCGEAYCFIESCNDPQRAKCLQHTNPYDQTFVFQQIRFSNLYTQGKCRDTGNASEARSVSASSQDNCLSMCNGTNAVPHPQGIAECFGVEWDAVNSFCKIWDQGATLSLTTTDTTAGYECYRRVYPVQASAAGAPVVCADDHAKCTGWAAKTPSECRENPQWMNANCKRSCGICTTAYTGQMTRAVLTGYGVSSANKGWREIQVGEASADPEMDRCQPLGNGPSRQLPISVPYPPSSPDGVGFQDRWRLSCIKEKRPCDSVHLKHQESCEIEHPHFSLQIDYFMDCAPGMLGCSATTQEEKDGDPPRERCNRGKRSQMTKEDPHYGYKIPAHLCSVDAACIRAGNEVYANGLSPADTLVAEEQFLRQCCTLRALEQVPCPANVDRNDCLLLKMCKAAENSGMVPRALTWSLAMAVVGWLL